MAHMDIVSKEAEAMLSEIKVTELPSYELGMERGVQRGIQQGIERGVERGLEKGLQQGLAQGVEQGERALLLRQLRRRFPALPERYVEQVQQASIDDIHRWSEQIFDATSLDILFGPAQ